MHRQPIGRDIGRADILPSAPVLAGSRGHWRIVYTAGPRGLAAGGAVRIEIPYGFSAPQCVHLTLPGFISVETDAAAELSLHIGDSRADGGRKVSDFGCLVYVQIDSGRLDEGETLALHYGGSPGRGLHVGAEVRYFDGPAEFPVGVDVDGSRSAAPGGFERLAEVPALEVLAGRPADLRVVLPSVHEDPAELAIAAVVLDRFGNGVEGEDEELTGEIVDSGPAVRVLARDPAGRLAGRSNPSVPRRPGEKNLYWGDLHVMTGVSAGLRSPAEALAYARDVSLLDFSSVNDGDDAEQFYSDEEWEQTRRAVRELYAPGEFVTLLGSEYHERKVAGDKNIVYRDADAPLLRWSDLGDDQPAALWRALRAEGRKALTIPHHTTSGSGALRPFDFQDDEHQRLVEIYSVWGNSECEGCDRANFWTHLLNWDNSVRSALNRGRRLGIVASSDSHDGRPGSSDWLRLMRGYFNGYTGVWAEELTREAIFDALYARRCYGTTGSRIVLRFAVSGEPMGGQIERGGPREVRVEAFGTDAIAGIDVIRNGVEAHTHTPADGAEAAEFTWEDAEPFDALARTDEKGEPFVYYYVRVRQEDGEMAWSSPVWVC